jgi:hypothetical protein
MFGPSLNNIRSFSSTIQKYFTRMLLNFLYVRISTIKIKSIFRYKIRAVTSNSLLNLTCHIRMVKKSSYVMWN